MNRCTRCALPAPSTLRRLMLAAVLLAGAPAWANWSLDNENSQLSFVTIKAGNIGEVHRFKQLSGSISGNGVATVEIALASIDTLIPIRDERMQSMLFESDIFPRATVSVPLDQQALEALTPGKISAHSLPGTLQLKDRKVDVTAHVSAMRVAEDIIVVATRQPILLSAGTVGLEKGVEKLREVAGLPSISQAVPVSFLLTFVQQ